MAQGLVWFIVLTGVSAAAAPLDHAITVLVAQWSLNHSQIAFDSIMFFLLLLKHFFSSFDFQDLFPITLLVKNSCSNSASYHWDLAI